MNRILLIGLVALLASINTSAQVNVFTEHQIVSMLSHGVNSNDSVQFPTGDYPYIGKIGLEYQRKKLTYSIAFIHRSNADLWRQDEYNYNGVSVGIKYSHCLTHC